MNEKEKEKEVKKIASAREISLFWTQILKNADNDLKDRLKVSELLAKELGMFSAETEKKEKDDPLEEMSLKERMALIEQLAKKYGGG